MSDVSGAVATFFKSYVEAFERFDADAIAAHFAYPCHITSDSEPAQLTAVASHDEWKAQIEGLVALYQQFGVSTADILEREEVELGANVTQARIRWQLKDAAGGDLYDFRGVYTLGDLGDGLKITALAHDELPKLMALLASGSAPGS